MEPEDMEQEDMEQEDMEPEASRKKVAFAKSLLSRDHEAIQQFFNDVSEHKEEYLTDEKLKTYSPKFLKIMQNIKSHKHSKHLIYSQFKTLEGIGLFELVLQQNDYVKFDIQKAVDGWTLEDDFKLKLKQAIIENKKLKMYMLHTGEVNEDKKTELRKIYNVCQEKDWDNVSKSIAVEVKAYLSAFDKKKNFNINGDIIQLILITASGAEGISLKTTRYVHIMEPYWNLIRHEQVIGRARRICSHEALPENKRNVQVYNYVMTGTFGNKHKNSPELEVRKLALEKLKISNNFTNLIKQSAIDCKIHQNEEIHKCLSLPLGDYFTYVPDIKLEPSDTEAKSASLKLPDIVKGKNAIYEQVSQNEFVSYPLQEYLDWREAMSSASKTFRSKPLGTNVDNLALKDRLKDKFKKS